MDSCPVPQEQRRVLLDSGLEDHILIFGSSWFPVGAAFAFGHTPLPSAGQAAQIRLMRPSEPGSVPVAKSLVNISDQQVLIEEVRYIDLTSLLSQLPQASTFPKEPRAVELANRAAFLNLSSKSLPAQRPMQIASAPYRPNGIVLDYTELSGNAYSYTFTAGSTYHIGVSFSVGPGNANLQQNAYVKCDRNAYLQLYGNVSCAASGNTVFTSKDDNSYGAVISGSTGSPDYGAAEGIWMYYQPVQTFLHNARVRWAQTAIRYDDNGTFIQNPPQLSSVFLEHSSTGVYLNIGNETLGVSQVTSCDVVRPTDSAHGSYSGPVPRDCGETPFAYQQLQHESTVTINPYYPQYVGIFAVNNGVPGILQVRSTDGGKSWGLPASIATGAGGDNLPQAFADVQAAYDPFGTLFLAYTTPNNASIVLAKSRDNGANWSVVKTFTSSSNYLDRPVIATGPDALNNQQSSLTLTGPTVAVWVMFIEGNGPGHLTLAGAQVDANGNVGLPFTSYTPGCSSATDHTCPVGTGLAVGPNGQVVMAYETREDQNRNRLIYINMDTDGLGPYQPTNGCTAQFPVNMEYPHFIPAQQNRGIGRVPLLAWDRNPHSPHYNRKYLAFADLPSGSNGQDTDIHIMYSDDASGYTWSSPRTRVNDDASGGSQFLPGIAVDSATGNVALSWYDCRNDSLNQHTQFFAAVSTDGFTTPQPRNFQLEPVSSFPVASSLDCFSSEVMNYGDYTGLAFLGGVFIPTWCSYPPGNVCGDVHTCRVVW